jgi:hypothetical protein
MSRPSPHTAKYHRLNIGFGGFFRGHPEWDESSKAEFGEVAELSGPE